MFFHRNHITLNSLALALILMLMNSKMASSFSNSRLACQNAQQRRAPISTHILSGKKSKNKTAASPVGDVAGSPPPSRVSNNINIPVRQQIAWAKAYKRLMGSNGCKGIGVTKKFRQDKGPKPVEEEYVEIDFKNVKPPALFIDGYNIIGYINSVEGRNIPLDDARDCLISDLCVLCTATGWFIEVVFDAYQVKSPEKTEIVDSIQVTYTGADETADNHIERRFQELSNSGYSNMVVATDDNVLRMVAGSAGAGYLSASMLLEELRIAYRGWEDMEEEMKTKAKINRPNIEDGLSDEMREAIATLKRNAAIAAQEQAAAKEAQNLIASSSDTLVKSSSRSPTTTNPKVAVSKPVLDKDLYKKRKKGASVANTGAWDVGELRRPSVADGLSDEMRNIIEKLKKEEEAAGRLC